MKRQLNFIFLAVLSRKDISEVGAAETEQQLVDSYFRKEEGGSFYKNGGVSEPTVSSVLEKTSEFLRGQMDDEVVCFLGGLDSQFQTVALVFLI